MLNKNPLLEYYVESSFINQLGDFLKKCSGVKLKIFELSGALQAIFFAVLYRKNLSSFVFLAQSYQEAIDIFSDLQGILPKEHLLFYPASYISPYRFEKRDDYNMVSRVKVLQELYESNRRFFIVTYPEALFEKVITSFSLHNQMFVLSFGKKVSMQYVNEWLFDQEFHRVDFVNSLGEFSIRGDILDVFSFSSTDPFRIEFFGDEIQSLRSFDLESQKSLENFNQITLLPDLYAKASKDKKVSFFDLLSKDVLFFLKNGPFSADRIDEFFNAASKDMSSTQLEDLFIKKSQFVQNLKFFTVIEGVRDGLFESQKTFFLKSLPQPTFNRRFECLIKDIKMYIQKGYVVYLCYSNKFQIQHFLDFEEKEINFFLFYGNLHAGFIDETHKLICYTDHRISDPFHIIPSYKRKSIQALTFKSLSTLHIGDYVTHIDHGVGRFSGLIKINLNGKIQEMIKIMYLNNDILYVSVHSLYKITKFIGKDSVNPSLNKLGSPAWKQLKSKTKTKVKKLAFDLIELYAKRRVTSGFAFSPDTYIQNELEASFIYEDTPDQLQATQEVKADMESNRPMDRLICGDVGFGKTEVAMRAAFKAVSDNKQVVFLVPTTILAFQHYRSFLSRFKDFPISIDYFTRFRSSSDKKQILDRLKKGKIDLVIGTHQLINKNIRFKDLGLIIIDEEHKFGVSDKDRLKTLRTNVDILALTATPIPRTLQFSLMTARDLSIIQTPPPNRRPIDTRLIRFESESISEAVHFEISRGGQIFFIHNKLSELTQLHDHLQNWFPKASIAIAHGQMKDKKREEDVILDFIQGKIDLLLSTTIVESGLDIPNANTIFIYQAQNFGLADLHQMRGRVGRSSIQAFCYLITPPMSCLNDKARERLQAIKIFSDLGSGFHIAMKDLEIRGAGNLLGAEQSGFISQMGFDTYKKILDEAVKELKKNEFKLSYEQDKESLEETEEIFVSEVQIDTDMELLFPDNYVNNTTERMKLYQELCAIKDEESLNEFRMELKDRFGSIPLATKELLNTVQLKHLCRVLGFEKISLKSEVMLLYFIGDAQSSYYQSERFHSLLNRIHNYPLISLKEHTKHTNKEIKKLILRIEKVTSVSQATSWLKKLTNSS